MTGRVDLEGPIGVAGDNSAVSAVVDWYGVSDVTTMPSLGDAFTPPGTVTEPGAKPEERIDVVLDGVPVRAAAERDFSPVAHTSALG